MGVCVCQVAYIYTDISACSSKANCMHRFIQSCLILHDTERFPMWLQHAIVPLDTHAAMILTLMTIGVLATIAIIHMIIHTPTSLGSRHGCILQGQWFARYPENRLEWSIST